MGQYSGQAAIMVMATALCAQVQTAAAQDNQLHQFNIQSGDLAEAIRAFGLAAHVEILFPTTLATGKRTAGLRGSYAVANGITALLRGTRLRAELVDDGYVIRDDGSDFSGDNADQIFVTGSRIRGAVPASPLITLNQDDIRRAGQNNLGDAVRSLPQAFGGGQNPGVGQGVAGDSNYNINSASSLNLRGLGADATLTLLNGKRLTYSGFTQAVDISAIPLAAVDRIEILADGASALYGSDAVAGVANVILKRDFDGLSTTARYGGSTSGGNRQQEYNATAGKNWGSGGMLITYDFSRTTAINAGQRSYASVRQAGATLAPYIKQHSALLTGHQQLTEGLEFTLDAVFTQRSTNYTVPLLDDADFSVLGLYGTAHAKTFTISPALNLKLPGRWAASLLGSIGRDRSHYWSDFYVDGAGTDPTDGCYCNSTRSLEANAEGPLFTLLGGDLKLAVGGGYRSNYMHAFRTLGFPQNFSVRQDSYFGYGELYVPLVSPDQESHFLNRLTFTAALRYEDYPGIDRLATPKLGLVASPSPDLDLKASWGKSFKAPTLYQRFSSRSASLYNIADLGGADYPPSAIGIVESGGNPDLTAERANSWTGTVALHPRAIERLSIEVSYFDIRYRSRIVKALTTRAAALSRPYYAELVTLAPSDAQKLAALQGPITNYSDFDYDPASVVAIVDAGFRNTSSQKIHGIDVASRYAWSVSASGTMTATASASYLKSREQLTSGGPEAKLAGQIFNPPHWRARGSLSWDNGPLSLSSYVSYISGVTDQRTAEPVAIGGMTTVDLSIGYTIKDGPQVLRNVDILFSAQNILNDKPSIIATSGGYETPYDSTNYSPVGRFLGLSITKRW